MTGIFYPGCKARRTVMTKKPQKYSEAMEELKEILEGLESEQIDVDELSVKVKRAMELIKLCRQKIEDTEMQVKEIVKDFEKDGLAKA